MFKDFLKYEVLYLTGFAQLIMLIIQLTQCELTLLNYVICLTSLAEPLCTEGEILCYICCDTIVFSFMIQAGMQT